MRVTSCQLDEAAPPTTATMSSKLRSFEYTVKGTVQGALSSEGVHQP